MAVIAIVAATDMGRVLASSDRSIVARRACTDYLRVINRIRRLKERRVVTVFAHVARQNVILVFTYCRRAIVAG